MSVRREHCLRLRGLIEGEDWQRAGDELEGLRQRYPMNAALCTIEGLYWAARGDWPRALCRFQRALVWDRDDANTVFNLGVTWWRLGAPLRGQLLMDYADQLHGGAFTWRLSRPRAPAPKWPSPQVRGPGAVAATRRVFGPAR